MRAKAVGCVVASAMFVALAAPSAAAALAEPQMAATAGTALPATTQVGTFSYGTNVIGCVPGSVFQARVNWGDGSAVQAGTVAALTQPALGSPCEYVVLAGHTYATAGTFPLSVTVSTPGDLANQSGSGSVTVADATLTASAPVEVDLPLGSTTHVELGTFTTTNELASPSYYSAQINWGDGLISSGRVIAGPQAGSFYVVGTHPYAAIGSFPLTATISDAGGASTVIEDTAEVADATMYAARPITDHAYPHSELSAPIAYFQTADLLALPADFTARIRWGDGRSSSGTITAASTTGVFTVSGSHEYATTGSFPTSVTVTDPYGATVAISGAVDVAIAKLYQLAQLPPDVKVADRFSGLVLVFGDGAESGTAGAKAFHATVEWGDGLSSGATIVPGAKRGEFAVEAHHAYVHTGAYRVAVTVSGPYKQTLKVVEQAVVSYAPPGHFRLPINHAHVAAGNQLEVRVQCPRGEVLCRGFVDASQVVQGHALAPFSAVLFILPAGRSAVIDLPLYVNALRRGAGSCSATIRLTGAASDPAENKYGLGVETIKSKFWSCRR